MSRIARFSVLVASLMSLFAVLSSSAGAVTWDNSGNTHFNATSNAGTLSSTSTSLACVQGDATAKTTTPAGAITPDLVDATLTFTTCNISGQVVSVHCGVTLVAHTFVSPVTTGTAAVTCSVYLGANKTCHLEGTVAGSYTNPSGATAGVLTTGTSNLRTTAGTIACLLGNHNADLSPLTFRVTSGTGGTGTLGPIINRTA